MVATIAKLSGPSVGAYYLAGVGRLAEVSNDGVVAAVGYYNGHGEMPGSWLGNGVDEFGLGAGQEVDPDAFRALLEGIDPVTGEPLREEAWFLRGKKLVPGFDLTFSAPKSVSTLWALGDARSTAAVERAQQEAVQAAIRYLEDHACRVRRGRDGLIRYQGAGLIAAAFQHRTSRAQDPQMHTHVVIPNIAKGPDGRWSSLDAIELYDHYKTAGAIYHAAQRAALSRELDVQWTTPDANGLSEISGVDPKLREAWSKRRAQIENEVLSRGGDLSNAAHCEAATLATRAGKEGGQTTAELREGWQVEAAELGFTRERLEHETRLRLSPEQMQTHKDCKQVAAVCGAGGWTADRVRQVLREANVPAHDLDRRVQDVMESRWCPAQDRDIYALDWLTANQSSFTRRQLIQALARLDGDPAALEERTQALLADNDHTVLLTMQDEHGVSVTGTTVRAREQGVYTTPEVLAAERRVLDVAAAGANSGAGRVSDATLDAVLADRPTIGGDQAALVTHLLTGGHRVSVGVGPAGTGKTYALDAAREGWQAEGYTVVGCSTSAQAALNLQAGSSIDSSTIDSLLLSLDRGTRTLEANTVIVVDEAGMVGTRKLDKLAQAVASNDGCKLVLVGDHHQLTAVEAGGLFRELFEAHPQLVAELETNRRQKQQWERAALARMRTANAEQAADVVAEFVEHDRVVAREDRDAVLAAMAADYWDIRETDLAETRQVDGEQVETTRGATALLMAATRADVAELNRLAIREAVARGHLDPERQVEFGDRSWHIGQAVLAGHNDRAVGVLNGQSGTVAGVEQRETRWRVTVELDPSEWRPGSAFVPAADGSAGVPQVGGVHVSERGGRAVITAVQEARNARGQLTGWRLTTEARTATWETTREPQVGQPIQRQRGGQQRQYTVVGAQAIQSEQRLAVDLEDGQRVWLPAGYAAEHLEDGYAMTTHKAQGRTVDAGLAFVAGMSREALYVALSRGRGAGDDADADQSLVNNRAYVVGDPAALRLPTSEPEHEPADPGSHLRHGRVTAAEDDRTAKITMVQDYWTMADRTDPQLRAAQERAVLAEQAVQDAMFHPTADKTAALAELRAAKEELRAAEAAAQERAEERERVALMVAKRRQDVSELNQLAIAAGVAAGQISAEQVEAGERTWHVGQRVLVTVDNTARGLARGDLVDVDGVTVTPARWTATVELADGRQVQVTRTDTVQVGDRLPIRGSRVDVRGVPSRVVDVEAHRSTTLRLRLPDGSVVEVSDGYAGRGLVDGYAVTAARAAQVGAADTRLLYTAGLEPEAKAALTSPDTGDTRLYVVGSPTEVTLSDQERERQRMLDELARQAGRSGAEMAASGVARSQPLPNMAALQEERRQLAHVLAQAPPGAAAERATVVSQLQRSRQLEEEARARVAALRAVGSLDPFTEASYEAHQTESRRLAQRLTELQSTAGNLCPEDQQRADWIERHTPQLQRWQQVTEQLDRVAGLTAAAAEADPAGYHPPVPGNALHKATWRGQVLAVETYRARWSVDDARDALGAALPANPIQRAERDAVARLLGDDVDAPARQSERAWSL